MKVYVLVDIFIGCDSEHVNEENAVVAVFRSIEAAKDYARKLVRDEWLRYDPDELEIVERELI